MFGFRNTVILLPDGTPDLTERTGIWERYLSIVRNSVVGYGVEESFWLNAMLQGMFEDSKSAHKGYLEMHLN